MAQSPSKREPSRQLLVPLDASKIEGFKPEQPVKVLLADRKGPVQSQTAKLDARGRGEAKFALAVSPAGMRVVVGPADATDDELLGLQTITVDVPTRVADGELRLPPIIITPYFWWWWLRWCRDFVIRGRVVCPDGSPVPGAQVCAYDVDWWLWFSSTQQIACATTDANGAFEIRFRWCCGWWPWWWWNRRFWVLEPLLVERIQPVLHRDSSLAGKLRPSAQPSLASFADVLGPEGAALSSGREIDPSVMPKLGELLKARLPQDLELERLHIWPWWPWRPYWADCNPDVIFKVTQECARLHGGSDVIVEETVFDTRYDIPTTLDGVVLLAGDNACCAGDGGCHGGDCGALTFACSSTADTIGGNLAAPAAPVGYQAPGSAGAWSDRPFGGDVPISGTTFCMDEVDFYEFEWATAPGGPWNVMPPAASGAFTRSYIQWVPFGWHYPTFATSLRSGRNVFEGIRHYEAANPPPDWDGLNRLWVGNRDQMINWRTDGTFADGTYWLRVRCWDDDGAGGVNNGRIMKVCESDDEAFMVLTVDNRVVTGGPNDLHGNPCTAVHACTDEPDTAIVSIQIHRGGNTIDLFGCSNESWMAGDQVVIDFIAHDPDGHLATVGLTLHYDVNLVTDILPLGVLVPGPASMGVPAAAQVGPNYNQALGQGAARPTWAGGVMRLILTGAGLRTAFPYPCCYQLRLDVYKRTIVSCGGYHRNVSETSFTYG